MFGLIVLAVAPGASARAEDSDAELAKKLSNPVAGLVSVPLQGNSAAFAAPVSVKG